MSDRLIEQELEAKLSSKGYSGFSPLLLSPRDTDETRDQEDLRNTDEQAEPSPLIAPRTPEIAAEAVSGRFFDTNDPD